MNIFFYCIIFAIGILFGSFYTLAVHRIPRKEDITHTHSYCPNCNNKLGFFELIPVFSYIFLRGKCKHCGEKIRIRYLLLELLSGVTFLSLALSLHINVYNLQPSSLIFFGFSSLYITCLFITAGIDKENRKIEKSVLYFGVIVATSYIVYLYIVEQISIYRYVMYLIAFLALLIADNVLLKKYVKNSYVNGILILITIMAAFTGEFVGICTIYITLLAIAIYMLISKIKNIRAKVKTEENLSENVKIAYFLSSINIIVFLTTTAICNM